MQTFNTKHVFKLFTIVFFSLFVFSSCSEEAAEGEELVGTWTGVSIDSEAPNDFEIRDNFTFQLPVIDQRTGTWTYRNVATSNCDSNEWDCSYDLTCTGFLVYKSKIDNTYTFEEGLSSGDCVEGGLGEFEVVNENTIKYRFIFNQVVSREATLTKS